MTAEAAAGAEAGAEAEAPRAPSEHSSLVPEDVGKARDGQHVGPFVPEEEQVSEAEQKVGWSGRR